MHPPESEILIYQPEDGKTRIEVRLDEGTVWLNQLQLVDLFQSTKQNISLHIRNIYAEGELAEDGTVKEYLTVQSEGTRQVERSIKYYNLDVIIAVGYRVRSQRGTRFRQWATARLSEYLVKGFVMDDARLKNPPGPGVPDYFDEMLERIRDIRSAERRMYLQVRNILALAADYEPREEETQQFFQVVQNKLHYAATGKTAPELIAERANHLLPNMGLTVWKGEVVRKGDVTIAKNYLNENEITELNRIVSMFLDYAEDQARRRKQIFMRNWREKLDSFLAFSERNILNHSGRVSREEADHTAQEQYELFHKRRLETAEEQAEERYIEDLTKAAKKLERIPADKKRGKGKKQEPKTGDEKG